MKLCEKVKKACKEQPCSSLKALRSADTVVVGGGKKSSLRREVKKGEIQEEFHSGGEGVLPGGKGGLPSGEKLFLYMIF